MNGRIELLPLLSVQGTTVTPDSPFFGSFLMSKDTDLMHEAFRPQGAPSACLHDLAFMGGAQPPVQGARLHPGSPLEVPRILRLECLAKTPEFLVDKGIYVF